MKEIIQGRICRDTFEGSPSIQDEVGYTESLVSKLKNISEKYNVGEVKYYDIGLGAEFVVIPKCKISIYYSYDSICVDDLQLELMLMLEGFTTSLGCLTGYSEFTITGLETETAYVGGHDLKKEIDNHMGEYIIMIIEF